MAKASQATPDAAIFIEPTTTRSITEWTPGLIKAARASADAGNLELAADFCEWALGDDRVSSALATRTNGLVSLPPKFEAARGMKRAVKALEAGEDWWAAYPAATLAQLLAWGRFLGVGLANQVWVERGDGINRLIPKIKVWHPRNLRFDLQRGIWKVRTANRGEIDITPGDGNWILFTPYGESRPWAFGAWRPVSYWRLLKQYAIEDWGFHSGKTAGGHLVAESDADSKLTNKDARKELANDMFAAQANSAFVPPPGFTIKMVEAAANTWQTFEAQKNAADVGNAVAILGQNLSTEVTGPVATGATLHGKVLQVYIVDDNEKLHTCVRDQSLRYWAEFNFGNGSLAPWTSYDVTPPEDQKQKAEVGKTKADTARMMASIGVFTVNEVRIAAGHEPLEDGKGGDELVKLTPAVPSGPSDQSDTGEEDTGKALEIRDSDPLGVVRLRSGRTVRVKSGLVQGQLYADALADKARDRAAETIDEDVAAVLEAIDGGESYEDIRKRIVKAYEDMNPDKLAELTAASMTMAELAGRHAMNEDV